MEGMCILKAVSSLKSNSKEMDTQEANTDEGASSPKECMQMKRQSPLEESGGREEVYQW